MKLVALFSASVAAVPVPTYPLVPAVNPNYYPSYNGWNNGYNGWNRPVNNLVPMYYVAKKNNLQLPTFNLPKFNLNLPKYDWNLPNINLNPITQADKTFLTNDILPAHLASYTDNTAAEGLNWYRYMKKNFPSELALPGLLPAVVAAGIATGNGRQPYVPLKIVENTESVNAIPPGYEGKSFGEFENLGNSENFFEGNNARYLS